MTGRHLPPPKLLLDPKSKANTHLKKSHDVHGGAYGGAGAGGARMHTHGLNGGPDLDEERVGGGSGSRGSSRGGDGGSSSVVGGATSTGSVGDGMQDILVSDGAGTRLGSALCMITAGEDNSGGGGIAARRFEVVLLSTYPRSGNSWTKLLVKVSLLMHAWCCRTSIYLLNRHVARLRRVTGSRC